jgi:hypothetical protein
VIYGGSTVYHLGSGELKVGGSMLVGVFGTGAFMQTGGALSTPLLQIGPSGSFTWNGGDLNVTSVQLAGRMSVAQGSGRTLLATNVDIDNTTGKLDLADNSMIIDYPGDTPDGPVQQLRADLHDGALFTSVGGATRRLGWADNSVWELPGFAGHSFLPGDYTQLLVTCTWGGDANLDRRVDMMDLGALATHWQAAGNWVDGDFDYNGVVDVNDLGLLATNWQPGVGNPLGPSLQDALANLGLPNVSVPEPASVGLVLAVALKCHRRRRTRQLVSEQVGCFAAAELTCGTREEVPESAEHRKGSDALLPTQISTCCFPRTSSFAPTEVRSTTTGTSLVLLRTPWGVTTPSSGRRYRKRVPRSAPSEWHCCSSGVVFGDQSVSSKRMGHGDGRLNHETILGHRGGDFCAAVPGTGGDHPRRDVRELQRGRLL